MGTLPYRDVQNAINILVYDSGICDSFFQGGRVTLMLIFC